MRLMNGGLGKKLVLTTMSSTIFDNRSISGTFIPSEDNFTYNETFDLSDVGIYEFIAISVNGHVMFSSSTCSYNKNTEKLIVAGFQFQSTDKITLMYNKIDVEGLNLEVATVSVSIVDSNPTIFGNYEVNPNTYSETYQLEGIDGVKEFLGVNINGALYCHPDFIEYNRDTSQLTIKQLKLLPSDKICLIYNKLKEV